MCFQKGEKKKKNVLSIEYFIHVKIAVFKSKCIDKKKKNLSCLRTFNFYLDTLLLLHFFLFENKKINISLIKCIIDLSKLNYIAFSYVFM